jgi:hypothetical protein
MVTVRLMTPVDAGVRNPDAETWGRVTETMDLLIQGLGAREPCLMQ